MARGKSISSLVGNTFAVCGEDFLRKSCYTFLGRHIKLDQTEIGKFIATLRKEKGLTQEKLGEKLGVTNKTISRWESGNYIADVEMLSRLSIEFVLFAIKINGNDIFLILGAVGGLLAVLFYVVLYNRMMVYVENHAYQAV